MGRRGGLSLGRGDLVLLHSRPRTVGMWAHAGTQSLQLSKRDPRSPTNLLSAIAPVLLLLTSEVGAARQGRVLTNLFGVLGHAPCSSSDESGDGQMVGRSMQLLWNCGWITQPDPGRSVLQRGGVPDHGRQRDWILPTELGPGLQSGAA